MVVRDFGLPLGEMTGACTERERERERERGGGVYFNVCISPVHHSPFASTCRMKLVIWCVSLSIADLLF